VFIGRRCPDVALISRRCPNVAFIGRRCIYIMFIGRKCPDGAFSVMFTLVICQ
jgi:hypothetical protein